MHLHNKTTKQRWNYCLMDKNQNLSEKLKIKNINDSVDKEITGKFKNKPTEKQIKNIKNMVQSLLKACLCT